MKRVKVKNLNTNVPMPLYEDFNLFLQSEDDEGRRKMVRSAELQNEQRRRLEKNLLTGEQVTITAGDYIGSRGIVLEIS